MQTYFQPRVAEATKLGNAMIAKIFEKIQEEEEEGKQSKDD